MPKTIKPVTMTGVWYTPNWGRNEDGSSDVCLHLRGLTAAEYTSIVQATVRANLQGDQSDEAALRQGSMIVRRSFELCVLDTSGIFVLGPSGEPSKPEDGGALYDALAAASVAQAALIDEIYTAIMSETELSGDDLGNCDVRLDSSTPTTKKAAEPGNGRARNATAKTRRDSTRKK